MDITVNEVQPQEDGVHISSKEDKVEVVVEQPQPSGVELDDDYMTRMFREMDIKQQKQREWNDRILGIVTREAAQRIELESKVRQNAAITITKEKQQDKLI